jgi:D-alanyl-D-alanine carboxypeptidase/D-alanyl-D-alanine-endopeptidase (penicillin-binding protein 4)
MLHFGLLLALGMAAPGASPAQRTAPNALVSNDSTLRIELDSLVDASLPRGAQFAAAAIRARDGALVWGRNAHTRQMPASTQKVFTTEVALRVLGPKFRFSTQLYGRGAQNGADWIGDLILVGSGDPTLGLEWGATLNPLVNALQKRGIRKVSGSLIALDTLCGAAPWGIWPPDWTFGNARDLYGAPIAGLNWNLNRDGWRPSQEPRLLVLKNLRQALSKKGIAIGGPDSVLTRDDSLLALPRTWTSMGQTQSPMLESILRPFLWESINQLGEAMVLRMGAGFAKPGEDLREAGMRRVRSNLQASGANIWEMEMRDGSGLSRYDAIPPLELARLLQRSSLGTGSTRTVDFLAAGGQGTLRKRFRNLPDPAWILAKTGTLDRVSNLCGLVRSPLRDTLSFAIFCQNYNTGAASMRRLQDKIVSLLAGVPIRKIVEDDDTLPAVQTPVWPTIEILPDFPAWRNYHF